MDESACSSRSAMSIDSDQKLRSFKPITKPLDLSY